MIVIKLQFIGFHVWDIPVGVDTAPGWKYAYAVGCGSSEDRDQHVNIPAD